MNQNKEIRSVAWIGLGALGVNFAHLLAQAMPSQALRIVVDEARLKRYREDGIYLNQVPCEFNYVVDHQPMQAADLVIIATKAYHLPQVIHELRYQVDEHTLIMCAVNGLSSESYLAQYFPKDNIIYTVAQGMDATRKENQVVVHQRGELCFGAIHEKQSESILRIARFFDQTHFPYRIQADIIHHQWGKFMLNVGLNQVVAAMRGTYASIQKEGVARERMIAAMREVVLLSAYEGICLNEQELWDWVHMCDQLDPNGMPSMAQDVMAGRMMEIELFSGEVLRRAKHYGMPCPINEALYHELCAIQQKMKLS